jgi:hypothetical protein
MKAKLALVCLGFFAWAGAPGAADPPGTWDPALVEGGFMFKDAAAFREYLLSADSVAVGRLTAWDGQQGQVRVEKVHRGAPGREPAFAASGGLVRAARGDKVLVVLAADKGRTVLHSYCAASGLFPVTGDLDKLVAELLSPKK